ncbi:4-nitrophenylphosphatase [Malassezia psittaci]|uniref:4-nitrophenylphosphatase n=1 Tax=Malassezia psittaci TaxID=1821823 RepID=A0AAF0F9U2_9BASI|nr:4-nitrophenylphosphatase [Malassezia psittaci]
MKEVKAPKGTYRFLEDKGDFQQLVDRYDNFLFDCDGVLWFGTDVFPGVISVLQKLRKLNKQVLFVTNNASKSRRDLLDRFESMGVQAAEREVFSSAYASALYLKEVLQFPKDRKVFVVGMSGLEHELDAVGIQHIGGTVGDSLTQDPEQNLKITGTDFSPLLEPGVFDDSVAAVMCGIDTDMNYVKMAKAFRYLTRQNATEEVKSGEKGGGCHFLCTNQDSTFPSKSGSWPGAGSVWAGIQESTGRKPTVIGKPNQPMLDTVFAGYSFDRSRTLMVGDRLNTDIAFGAHGGLDTLLVLSGISQEAEILQEGAAVVPTYVTKSLGELDVLDP